MATTSLLVRNIDKQINKSMSNLVAVKKYFETDISFEIRDGEVFANATNMCKHFGKRPSKFLERPNTKRYLRAMESVSDFRTPLIMTVNGDNGGTWIHEKLILKLAQWLDVDFEIWCDEQVATLMKDGQVSLQPAIPQTYAEALRLAAETVEANEALKLEVSAKSTKIEEDAPKVNYFNKIIDSEDCLTITQIAGSLEMTSSALNDLLKQEGVQYKQSGQWHLKSAYKGNGYTRTRTHAFTKHNGDSGTSHYLVWTERGREFICDLLERV